MNNVLAVYVLDCLNNLLDVIAGRALRVSLARLALEIFIQLSSICIFQDKINTVFVTEEAIHRKNILVPQMRPDFDFLLNLFLNPVFGKLLFI